MAMGLTIKEPQQGNYLRGRLIDRNERFSTRGTPAEQSPRDAVAATGAQNGAAQGVSPQVGGLNPRSTMSLSRVNQTNGAAATTDSTTGAMPGAQAVNVYQALQQAGQSGVAQANRMVQQPLSLMA